MRVFIVQCQDDDGDIVSGFLKALQTSQATGSGVDVFESRPLRRRRKAARAICRCGPEAIAPSPTCPVHGDDVKVGGTDA